MKAKKIRMTQFAYSKKLDEIIVARFEQMFSVEERIVITDLGYRYTQGETKITLKEIYPEMIREMMPDFYLSELFQYDMELDIIFLQPSKLASFIDLEAINDWQFGIHNWEDKVSFKENMRNLLICDFSRYEQTKPSLERMRNREMAKYCRTTPKHLTQVLQTHKVKWKTPTSYRTQKKRENEEIP